MSERSQSDVAIIGMACIYPGAANARQFWENNLHKFDAISDPPPDWEAELYYDPESEDDDRTYCKRGGYLGKLAQFNAPDYGVMPNAVNGCVPDHFLALRVAYEALSDAGYDDPAKLSRLAERTGVILGHGNYINRGHSTALQHLMVVDSFIRIWKQTHPEASTDELAILKKTLKASLPPLQQQHLPGMVPNLISGRIANRLDLMGPSYTVDGACASSLLAVDLAMRDLVTGRCDMALAGGAHCGSTPPIVIAFAQLKALSRKGEIRPFDAAADGTLLSEGVGMLVLKRLADAERAGDRIYAVLKGMGTASDGRAMGLLAPRLEGEELALRRAYEAAAIDPATIELIEGHGTATLVGDATELEALNRVFGERAGDLPRIALGTVKSMIGHSIPASGLASLIRVALALHHKILPPTIHCDSPNNKLQPEKSNLYINTETRPWIHGSTQSPRRAGVSAFGFGGINAHAVLEEYTGTSPAPWLHQRWDSELFILSEETPAQVVASAKRLRSSLAGSLADVAPKDLAYSLNCRSGFKPCRLALIASSIEDLGMKLDRAIAKLDDPNTERLRDASGIYYFQKPLASESGKLAFVFPGEGAQYMNMLADLCLHFPEVRRMFDLMDRAFVDHSRGYLPSEVIVPPPMHQGSQRLWAMDVGTEAVFCADLALFSLLDKLGIRPDAMVGHSTGENSAVPCSGMVDLSDDDELINRVQVLNKIFEELRDGKQITECALVAVGGVQPGMLQDLAARSHGQLYIAMDNCPNQVVMCGTESAIADLLNELKHTSAVCQRLPFARAYHTPWFQKFSDMLLGYLQKLHFTTPRVPLYSCIIAQPFPDDPDRIREIASGGWSRTVRFRETIERMYNDGIRIFVEVGPRGNLTSFIDDTLRGKPHLALPSNLQHRSGILQLHHLLGQLAAHGVDMRLDALYERRDPRPVDQPASQRRMTPMIMGMQPLRLPADFRPFSRSQPVATVERELPQVMAPASTSASNGHVLEAGRIQAQSPVVNVLQQHFAVMQQFLHTQHQVFGSYLSAKQTAAAVVEAPASAGVATAASVAGEQAMVQRQPAAGDAAPKLPFISEITEHIPGVRARMLHTFSLEPLYEHHALGFDVSETDRSLVGLCVVPLTVSVEILAEAASVLEPGRLVIGMRQVRSQRWIMLDEPGPTIELTAERKQPGVVEVKIREANPAKGLRPVWIEGTVLFGDRYPESSPLPFKLENEKPSHWTPGTLYPWGMFHGSFLRGVISVDRTGDNGGIATLKILPRNVLLRGQPQPNFLLDPVCLDSVGQLTAFWSQEHLDPVGDVFPHHFEQLECFGPLLQPGTRVEGRILITHVSERQVSSILEVIDPAGQVVYRLRDWEGRRFPQSEEFWAYRVCPRDVVLSKPCEDWIVPPDRHDSLACYRLDAFPPGFFETSFGVWLKILALLSLGPREREFWSGMKGVEKRRVEWLLGRCVAKDAVRQLVKKRFGIALYPADIEILADGRGQPFVDGEWAARLGIKPVVSISHSHGVAVALATLSPEQLVGIDLESVNPQRAEFEGLAFSKEERALLEALPEPHRNEWSLRLWCAKEALGKALGRGLSRGLQAIFAKQIEPTTGFVHLSVRDGLLQDFPGLSGKTMLAYTKREQHFIISTFVSGASLS